MKKRHLYTKKKKEVKVNLFKVPSRHYVAGFPIARNAFHNQLWDWNTLENILIK